MPSDEFDEFLFANVHPSVCILCRKVPPPGEATREHVFPRWLQHRFKLWDLSLTLQNQTQIPYRKLTVLACAECNNLYLKRLEDIVCAAVHSGYDAVAKLPKLLLMQWLAKIYLGILTKECQLKLDRRNPSIGNIMTPQELERFKLLSFWLNTCRLPGANESMPSSMIVRRAQVPKLVLGQFDFIDSVEFFDQKRQKGGQSSAAAIRMADITILVHFMDYNLHNAQHAVDLQAILPEALHPQQFRELAAMFIYKASLMEMTIEARFLTDGQQLLHRYNVIPGLPEGEVYREWDNEQYANILAFYLGLPVTDIFKPPNTVMSWLHDDLGRPREMPLIE